MPTDTDQQANTETMGNQCLLSVQGKWWLPDKEGERLDGTLRHEPESAVQLATGHPGFLNQHRPDFVLGESSDGRPVTVYRARISDTDNNQVIYDAEAALIGIHAKTETDLQFRVMSVYYPLLDAWLAMTLIQTPQTTPFVAGGFDMAFVQDTPAKPATETSPYVRAVWFLRVASDAPMTFSELRHTLLRRLTAFMTLAQFDGVMPMGLRLGKRDTDGLGDVRVHTSGMSVREPAHSPLLWYKNADGKLDAYLDKWLANAPRLDEVYDLYVSAVRGRTAPVRTQFLSQMQALEGYLRVVQGDTASYLRPEIETALKQQMLAAAGATDLDLPANFTRDVLPLRLKRFAEWSLARRLREQLRVLERALSKPADAMLRSLPELHVPYWRMVEVRNLLTHVDEPSEGRAVAGREEPWVLSRFAKLVLEASLLRSIGMADNKVADSVYWQYQHHGRLQGWWNAIKAARQLSAGARSTEGAGREVHR